MRWPNIHVVFSPKRNFQVPTSPNINIFPNFGTYQDHSILEKIVSAIFQKKFGFNFICVLVIFSKIHYD